MNPLLLCGALWTSVVPDPMGGAGSSDCLAVGASMAGRFERHWPIGLVTPGLEHSVVAIVSVMGLAAFPAGTFALCRRIGRVEAANGK